MIQIQGWLYNGIDSKRTSANLTYSDDGTVHCVIDTHLSEPFNISAITFSDRIGNTPRFIHFPDKTKFETGDNQAVDKLRQHAASEGYIKRSFSDKWAHAFESSYRFIVLTLLLVVISSASFVQYGIPYFSKEFAMLLPPEAAKKIGHGSLEILDKSIMQASELSEERKAALQTMFSALKPQVDDSQIPLEIVFRHSKAIGANAFALPSGTIIFTDDMVNLAEHDDELKTIMLHEIGHIVNRHSLRQLVQQSSLALFVVLVTGDVSTTSSMILALPGLLLEAKYSQNMETEADNFALERLAQHNLDSQHFVAIMQRLEATQASETGRKEQDTSEKNMMDYFSSHPSTTERLKRFVE